MTDSFNEPNWAYFRTNNETPEETFEGVVAKRLFCAEVDVQPEKLSCPPGLPGIECCPVKTGEGWVGYQAKHSHDGKQNVALFSSINKALKRKKSGEWQLDKIYCYSSGAPPKGTIQALAELEKSAASHDVALVWRFSDQIIETLRDSNTPLVQRASREFFEALPQPTLLVPTPASTASGASRYHFGQQAVPFIGRENEVETLSSFLDTDVPFSWWSVVGKGGSGKSRLLLFLGELLESDWQWGWLADDEIAKFSFSTWCPMRHSLLILDYVTGREETLRQLFEGIYSMSHDIAQLHRVRIIILERTELQWLSSLTSLPIVSPWVKATMHSSSPYFLSALSAKDREELANTIITSSSSTDLTADELVGLCAGVSAEQAPLIMQIVADLSGSSAMDRTAIVREFLGHDRIQRWKPAGINAGDRDVLAVTTMAGGVTLSTASLSVDAKTFYSVVDRFDEQAVMVGGRCDGDEMIPLAPDLFGELYVLDHLSSLPALSSKPRLLLTYAAGVDRGRGLVGFFNRCVEDFPDHPALHNLVSPWSKETTDLILWQVILANTVDELPLSSTQRLALYSDIGRGQHGKPLGDEVVEMALFLRTLSSLSDTGRTKAYRGRIGIIDAADLSVFEGPPPDFLEQLYPEAYSDDLLADLLELPVEDQRQLLGRHFVTAMHHKLIQTLRDRERPVDDADALYHVIATLLKDNVTANYIPSIHAFFHLAANVSAALLQFARHRTNAEQCVSFVEKIRKDCRVISTTRYKEAPIVVATPLRDQVDAALSVLVMQTRVRDYPYLLQLLDELSRRTPAVDGSERRATVYVQVCVQAANSFDSEASFNAYQAHCDRCVALAKKFPNPALINALGMIHTQQARNELPYVSAEQRMTFLQRAVALARAHPGESFDVLRPVVTELQTRYQALDRTGDSARATQVHEMALQLVDSVGDPEYDERRKLYCGGLVITPLTAFVEGQGTIDAAAQAVDVLSGKEFIAFEQALATYPATFFNLGSQAANTQNPAQLSRAIEALELLEPVLPNSGIDGLLSHLRTL